jgi:hypothetical protein
MSIIFVILNVFLVLPIYFCTYYKLEDTALHVKCGLCINRRIAYNDIKTVFETRDPSASAGLSLDRVSINYSKGEILISPKNKQEFLNQLKAKMA